MLSVRQLNTLEKKSGIKNILTQNRKLKHTSKETGRNVYNFSIPAYKSMTGETVCPFAGECVKYCYAQKGNYVYDNIQVIMEYKFELTKHTELFIKRVCNEIDTKRPEYMRVHDSGDYYSLTYMKTWFSIARAYPDVKFYSYTKSHQMVRLAKRLNLIPDNYTFIFSTGSIQDNLINKETERHAVIFDSLESLTAAGYANASEIDIVACDSDNHKIGLIKH